MLEISQLDRKNIKINKKSQIPVYQTQIPVLDLQVSNGKICVNVSRH